MQLSVARWAELLRSCSICWCCHLDWSWDVPIAFSGNIGLDDWSSIILLCAFLPSIRNDQTEMTLSLVRKVSRICTKTFRCLITNSSKIVRNKSKIGGKIEKLQISARQTPIPMAMSCHRGSSCDALSCLLCVSPALASPWMNKVGGRAVSQHH